MSALAGILYDDRRPVGRDIIARLGLLNQERGRDGAGRYEAPGVLLLHYALHFDRLSRSERQPHTLRNGSVLTWDGRLDNRTDLSLRLRGTLSPAAPDVAFVAEAYERWGSAANEMLVGDWSSVLWDPTRDTLRLARDYMGNRPLFFTQQRHCFAWSTCLETLVALFDSYDDLDEQYMSGLLTFGPAPWTTPFRGIYSVPSAHCLEIKRGAKAERRRYWNFPLGRIRYQRADSYADHYRALLTEAVSVRLRANAPVLAELSGGYDSSAIVCIADWLVKNEMVEAPGLRPLSRVFRKSSESDESLYITAVERHCGLEAIRVDVTREERTLESFNRGFRPLNSASAFEDAMTLARASGGRVLLSGELGDLITSKSSDNCVSLLEHLRHLDLWSFLSGCYDWSLRSKTPLLPVLRRVLAGTVPPRFLDWQYRRHALRAAAHARRVNRRDVATAFMLNPEFARRTQPTIPTIHEELRRFPAEKRPLVRGLTLWSRSSNLTTPDTLPELRVTYPFSHRPLVELVLAIPQSVLWKPHTMRALVKQACAGLMPDLVLHRDSKGYSAPATSRFYRPLALALLDRRHSLHLVERGYLDQAAFVKHLEAFVEGKVVSAGHLAKLIAIEAWFQHGRQRTNQRIPKSVAV